MRSTCGGATIARPEHDDRVAIQRIVDLRTADPSLTISEAARRAVEALPGQATEVERLRKKYRMLRDSNQLPEGGEAARVNRMAEAIGRTYDQRDARRAQAGVLLPETEDEVQSLGIDPHQHDLSEVLGKLEVAWKQADDITDDEPDWIAHRSMTLGLNKEGALARYFDAVAAKQMLEKQVAALRKLRNLRRAADLPF